MTAAADTSKTPVVKETSFGAVSRENLSFPVYFCCENEISARRGDIHSRDRNGTVGVLKPRTRIDDVS